MKRMRICFLFSLRASSRENARERERPSHSRLLSRVALAWFLATPPNGKLMLALSFFHNKFAYLLATQVKTDYEEIILSFHLLHLLTKFNPSRPNIHLQILETDLFWENLIKDQSIFSVLISLLILISFSLYKVWISLGENCGWSLLGLKGLTVLPFKWNLSGRTLASNYLFRRVFGKKKLDFFWKLSFDPPQL